MGWTAGVLCAEEQGRWLAWCHPGILGRAVHVHLSVLASTSAVFLKICLEVSFSTVPKQQSKKVMSRFSCYFPGGMKNNKPMLVSQWSGSRYVLAPQALRALVWLFQHAFAFTLSWKEPGVLHIPLTEPVTAFVKMQKIRSCSARMLIEFLLKWTENLKATTEVLKWLNFTFLEVLRSCFWQLLLQGHSKRVISLKKMCQQSRARKN